MAAGQQVMQTSVRLRCVGGGVRGGSWQRGFNRVYRSGELQASISCDGRDPPIGARSSKNFCGRARREYSFYPVSNPIGTASPVNFARSFSGEQFWRTLLRSAGPRRLPIRSNDGVVIMQRVLMIIMMNHQRLRLDYSPAQVRCYLSFYSPAQVRCSLSFCDSIIPPPRCVVLYHFVLFPRPGALFFIILFPHPGALFFIILLKDTVATFWNYGIRYSTFWHATLFKGFHPQGSVQWPQWAQKMVKRVQIFVKMNEIPRRLTLCWRLDVSYEGLLNNPGATQAGLGVKVKKNKDTHQLDLVGRSVWSWWFDWLYSFRLLYEENCSRHHPIVVFDRVMLGTIGFIFESYRCFVAENLFLVSWSSSISFVGLRNGLHQLYLDRPRDVWVLTGCPGTVWGRECLISHIISDSSSSRQHLGNRTRPCRRGRV